MIIEPAQPNDNWPEVRYTATNGIWELGLAQKMFGVRVQVGQVGRGWVEVDWCAGADPLHQLIMLAAAKTILEALPDDISPKALALQFPRQALRPYKEDPAFVEFIRGVLDNGYTYDQRRSTTGKHQSPASDSFKDY